MDKELLVSLFTATIPLLLAILKSHDNNKKQNNKIERLIGDVIDEQQRVKEDIKAATLVSTRLELLDSIKNDRGEEIVSSIFDRYKLLGGNSYVENRTNEYLNKQTEKKS